MKRKLLLFLLPLCAACADFPEGFEADDPQEAATNAACVITAEEAFPYA